jgi:heterodisulfide reductase subunit B
LHATAAEYDASTRAVAAALGLELREIPGWACCGATSAHSVNEFLAYALPAHTVANATERELIAPCAACYNRLRYTGHALSRDADLRRRVEGVLGRPVPTDVNVRHLLDVLARDVAPDAVKAHVTAPLGGVKVVCYYGCLLTRPGDVAAFDDVEEPRLMDNLMTAVGAQVLDWPHRTVCCGAAFALSRTDIVIQLTGKIVRSAAAVGADAVVVACPMCQSNLDLRQPTIVRRLGLAKLIPAVYFTQLLGLAFGLDARALGFDKIMVDTKPLLAAIAAGRAQAAAGANR